MSANEELKTTTRRGRPPKPLDSLIGESEEFQAEESVLETPVAAGVDLAAMEALMSAMQQTIAELKAENEGLKNKPEVFNTVVNNSDAIPDAVLSSKSPNSLNVPVNTRSVGAEPHPGTTLVHFLADGFTYGSRMFYRGEEAWLEDGLATLTPNQQQARFGQILFAQGSWPYNTFNLDDPSLNNEEREKLARIAREQQERQMSQQRLNFAQQRR